MTQDDTDPSGLGAEMPAWLDRLANTPIPPRRAADAVLPSSQGHPAADPDPETATHRGLWSMPGFGPMVRVVTSFGPVPAQALRQRDLVRTRSGEFRRIEWMDRMVLDEGFLKSVPSALPVLVRAGALGSGLPANDIVVSPEQVLCIAGPGVAPRHVVARELLTRPGVMRKPEQIFTYTRFHCGEPVEVQAEGLWLTANPPGIA
ncbi:MAG: Hint domain-containing protein [Rhodobacteraceae bacterium]|jgi:hypothetical protein|nr:Hint domain-containing protein [Paracoccaceae bacterium]